MHEAISITISFQRHKSPDLHAPVQLPLALQRSLGGLVSQGLLKRFSELRAKLAHSEHFYSVSVHSPEVVNYSTGGFDQIFRCPLSNLHRFQHIALIQSLRKDVLASHVPRQNLSGGGLLGARGRSAGERRSAAGPRRGHTAGLGRHQRPAGSRPGLTWPRSRPPPPPRCGAAAAAASAAE